MFPSVRLLLVATLASIAAIGCGLGLFAAFRVNHEPLTRLAHAGPPVQLVFMHAVPTPVVNALAAPFGERFQVEAPPPGNAEMPYSGHAVALASAPATPLADNRADTAVPAVAVPATPLADNRADAATAAPAVSIARPLTTTDFDQAAPSADQSPSGPVAGTTAAPDRTEAPEAPPPTTVAKAADHPAHKAVRHRGVTRRLRPQPDTAAQPTYKWAPRRNRLSGPMSPPAGERAPGLTAMAAARS